MLDKQANITIYENDSLENYYNNHIYFFKYEGVIRKLLINYKFSEKSYLFRTITNFIIKNERFCEIIKSYDIIIPVPISKKRYKERGYNQSYLMAKNIGKYFEIKVENKCLIKRKNIIEQSRLGKEERQKNIVGVYSLINPCKIQNKRILLIDDIYTTGSTANECCKTLLKANIKLIDVLTVAKD